MKKLITIILLFVTVTGWGQKPDLLFWFDNTIADSSDYEVAITNYANTFSSTTVKQGTHSWCPSSSDGRILTTDAYNLGTVWSASFWIYANTSTGTKVLMSNITGGGNNGFYVSINFTTNTVLFRSWDASLNEGHGSSSAGCFSDSEWFHLVVIVNGSTCSFYVNGTDVTSDGVIQDDFINNAVLSFGAYTTGGSTLWSFAYVDNIQLYKREIAQTGIDSLYNYGAYKITLAPVEQSTYNPVADRHVRFFKDGIEKKDKYEPITQLYWLKKHTYEPPQLYPDWTPDVLSGKILYVDISGSSSNDGLTESTPVTIADVGSKIDNTFDYIAISDTTHYGTITIDNVDKTYGDTLILTTWVKYNSGHKAQIKGLTEITGWTQSGNFWYKSSISGLPALRNDIYNETGMDRDVYMKSHMNGLYINDQFYEISKYPDSKTYFSIESTNGSTYVKDDQGVPIADYWDGATLASEVSTWINSKYTVTDYAANGTYYISNIYGSVYPVANMKYFLVNHRNAANNNGEWIIDHTTNRVDIYYDSDLNNEEVYLPTVDYVLELSNSSYVEVKNLSFYGANKIQVHNYQNLGASVNNCDFYRSPYAAIGFYGCDSSYAESNNIFYSGDNGIVSVRSDYNYFADNYIKGCGLTGTFGGDRDGLHLNGILTDSDYGDVIIERNIIDSTGYCGILEKDASEAINVSIQDNYVNGAMQLVSDGAGIYTFWNPYAVQKYIRGNLVTNTFENYAYHRNGTSESRAIYIDEGYPNAGSLTFNRMWLIDSNVVYKYPMGFYQNRETRKIHWRNNILANQQYYVQYYDYSYNYNTSSESGWNADSSFFTKNIVVTGPDVNGSVVYFTPDATIAEYENLIDSNRYVNPFADDGIIWLTNSGSPSYTRTLRDTIWVRANSTFEDNTTYNDLNWGFSDVSGITEDEMIWCFANWSDIEHTFDLGDAVFKDIQTGSNISGTLTIQPYKANVYLYVSGNLSSVDDPIYEDRIP